MIGHAKHVLAVYLIFVILVVLPPAMGVWGLWWSLGHLVRLFEKGFRIVESWVDDLLDDDHPGPPRATARERK